jgi:hypothetical protein
MFSAKEPFLVRKKDQRFGAHLFLHHQGNDVKAGR